MSSLRLPGFWCGAANALPVDDGTLVRNAMQPPGFAGALPERAAPVPATVALYTDPEIEALNLASVARKAAYALKKAHPSVRFTSGRRDKADQARAMAANVAKNRKWIEQTYARTSLRTRCQAWLDKNPDKTATDEIAAGLLTVLEAASNRELGYLSKHLSGEAFDVQPVQTDVEAIKKTIRGLPGLDRFLDTEGGLVRWHAQF